MARCSHVGKDLPSVTPKVHFGYKGKLEDLTMEGTLYMTNSLAWMIAQEHIPSVSFISGHKLGKSVTPQ